MPASYAASAARVAPPLPATGPYSPPAAFEIERWNVTALIFHSRTRPPTFVVFGTRTDALPGSYERYLVNGMRKELGFQGVPVRLNFRNSRNPYDE